MSNVSVKARSGRIKKTSDRQRAASFRIRHIHQVTNGYHASLTCKHDDPLGASNANILLAMQSR